MCSLLIRTDTVVLGTLNPEYDLNPTLTLILI